MINYAHRGASEYAPENTLSSFYLGMIQGANGIETDVHRTKDGVLVLFHDDTLDRVSDGVGKISRQVTAQNGLAYNEIIDFFGKTILLSNGEIDRKKLAGIVFSDVSKLEALNLITHKHIFNVMKEQIKKFKGKL